jgi:hypothetical protein
MSPVSVAARFKGTKCLLSFKHWKRGFGVQVCLYVFCVSVLPG